LLSAPAANGTFSTLFCKSFLRCLSPCHGGSAKCTCLVLPQRHRPSPRIDGSASRFFPRTRFSTDEIFEAAAIPLCSGLQVCLPPRSFLPLQVSLQGSRGFLRPSRTCVVTFARIGYALRPTTGNWRNEDFHLARFTALSTAPYSFLVRLFHPLLHAGLSRRTVMACSRRLTRGITITENYPA
jgi:hypothetical protein